MPLYLAGLCEAVNIAAGALEAARGEVHEVGGGQPEVDDVEALALHPLGEGAGELDAASAACRARRAPGWRPSASVGEAGEGGADGPAQLGVELVGHRARARRRP